MKAEKINKVPIKGTPLGLYLYIKKSYVLS